MAILLTGGGKINSFKTHFYLLRRWRGCRYDSGKSWRDGGLVDMSGRGVPATGMARRCVMMRSGRKYGLTRNAMKGSSRRDGLPICGIMRSCRRDGLSEFATVESCREDGLTRNGMEGSCGRDGLPKFWGMVSWGNGSVIHFAIGGSFGKNIDGQLCVVFIRLRKNYSTDCEIFFQIRKNYNANCGMIFHMWNNIIS